MQMYLISDNIDTYTGMRLAGVEGVVVHKREELKEAYLAVNPSAEIEIQTNDSTSGVNGAIEGTCDIGMASRELSDSESSQVTATAIAIDGIAVIVNSENPTDSLTSQNVKDIFTGTITTWADIA